MNVLVIGGTGNVGREAVNELVRRGVSVRVLTRDAARAASVPRGVQAVQGNLLEPASLHPAFDGVDAVFLVNALSPTEAHEGLLAVCAMREAGVKRVVYQSVHSVDKIPYLPHFGAKLAIEHGIWESGIPFTILRPNHFFQNDYMARDAILAGVYPQPIGNVGLSRVDIRDIAEAAAEALLSSDHEGETYELVGPDVLTGDQVAAIWSRALNREIRYADDLDAWARRMHAFLPGWLVYDLRLMFAHFQTHGLKASRDAIGRLSRLIRHPPRSFEAFATETAGAWNKT